ncbi:hypothetical protein BC833DRAFT_548023 [Globomyces pollinis-pini]|nr:hypothetical protein BC833DRAFT_548023 [Globomyces pollinis-pini]KAJ2999590.1 transcriptional repressor [Globomyces sp. JEL0801]
MFTELFQSYLADQNIKPIHLNRTYHSSQRAENKENYAPYPYTQLRPIHSRRPSSKSSEDSSIRSRKRAKSSSPTQSQRSVYLTPKSPNKSDQTDRQFICPESNCQASFTRKEHLQRHERIHTGAKPFQCHFPGCGKSFSRCDNKDTHYLTHTNSDDQKHKRKHQQ